MTRRESDITAAKTFLGPDDKAFLAEKRRRRAPRDPLPAIPDTPCCARCRNWHPPGKQDEFGRCRVAGYDATVPAKERPLITKQEAEEGMVMGFDYMSVRGFAPACSLFRGKE